MKQLERGVFVFDSPPSINAFSAVVGKKEGEGPLSSYFDHIFTDTKLGQNTWEQAESRLQTEAVTRTLKKANCAPEDVSLLFAGDLLNQCIGSTYGLRDLGIPLFGLYGACSTMAESLVLASLMTASGAVSRALAVTSSHFCSAERQFRFPLEYGGVRTPTAQWTVTGAGAALVCAEGDGPYVAAVTAGRIRDLGITDVNNMGAAMAPAAADTIKRFLSATKTAPNDYDLILTGDLGFVGSSLLCELLRMEQFQIEPVHNDCGKMIFNRESQDVHAGGSGCGCSASVLCSYILSGLKSRRLHRVLFAATGALMSPTSIQQGESIPGISHAVLLTASKEDIPWNC